MSAKAKISYSWPFYAGANTVNWSFDLQLNNVKTFVWYNRRETIMNQIFKKKNYVVKVQRSEKRAEIACRCAKWSENIKKYGDSYKQCNYVQITNEMR